ncbi:iron repressor protein [Corynebacterium kutscheri]|uniref:Diphtheria toxin repressor n=1 Tax=Corynebacterium kutscheri TaxID=35755 RepID=A0A0F6TEG7_9CORY|nr:metal-dependent transcriptional regulator [Corynebacterium kutscheri]AKE42134.1 iron (metal) dependent repressor, DtxR family [Corynebacterium kutscheri]VEH05913.1 iron repressor protein [Corynebacterium kutscheri]VEH10477.1 iron repressor protein [Corynebacterium kutscheri]VEH81802.1 iron repressor protein [Corynebacterium kutscheri]
MHVNELPEKTQDYLKVIWDMQERGAELVGLMDIAEKMGEKKSTASEAIKKLSLQGFVEHVPYSGVSLTKKGSQLAVQMIRRHRLLETFLSENLHYSWDEVHAEAEQLEHAVSDMFLERIEKLMGFPVADPHGDPIPTAEGKVEAISVYHLGQAAKGENVKIVRISDSDPELLRYLAKSGITPGTVVQVQAAPFSGMAAVTVAGGSEQIMLAESALDMINVEQQ